MYAQLRSVVLIPLMIVTLTSVGGCEAKTTGHSYGSATFGSRQVKFSVDGNCGILVQQDSATVTFLGGKVVVEKARALLNDKEVAKVPADAKVVQVEYAGGTLTITAD
jgi:hypothetical protein